MKRPPNMGREVLFQLSDVARSMRTYIDQCAREHGMTRAQWGVLVRLERQEGMTQAEMADEPRDPADLAGAADRPAVPARPRRAAPASARPACQPPLPDRQGARDAGAPRPARQGGHGRGAGLAERGRHRRPPAEAAADQDATFATPPASAGAGNGANGKLRQGYASWPSTRSRSCAPPPPCGPADAVAARDADGDRSGAGRRRRPVSSIS